MNVLCACVSARDDFALAKESLDKGGHDDVQPIYLKNNNPHIAPVRRYQEIFENCGTADLLVYIHDDLEITDEGGWLEEIVVIMEEHPKCMVAGLGGATGIGLRDIYKKPYHISQLARTGYVSNQTDWQVHGAQETGDKRVAVLDGFLLAIRTSLLEECGGWPKELHHTGYDTWICCEALERGYEVWMTGVSCTHHGGRTSCSEHWDNYCKEHDMTPGTEHAMAHRWLFERFRRLLPYEVPK